MTATDPLAADSLVAASPLKVLIVDDEPLARARLDALVKACAQPACQVVAQCANAEEAMAALATVDDRRPDAVLLDIQMPGVDGLELAARLRALDPAPAIVFVTAHGEHALRAFDLAAVDYLTKPVRPERLVAALERVARQRVAQPSAAVAASTRPVLVASERGRVARIPVDDVLYLKAELKYVTLRTAQRSWVLDESLTELESRLNDADRFIRIHRNALVSRDAVTALDKHTGVDADDDAANGEAVWAVHIRDAGEWLPVSRRQLAAVRAALHRND